MSAFLHCFGMDIFEIELLNIVESHLIVAGPKCWICSVNIPFTPGPFRILVPFIVEVNSACVMGFSGIITVDSFLTITILSLRPFIFPLNKS